MEDVRQVAQERASRPKKAPVGASFESERQRSKNALVKQIASQDGRNVRMIAAATETPEEKRILRVAAYCRVSTDDIDQALSIHLQIQQYMKKVKENPNWKYAGCYVDAPDIIGLKQNPTNGRRFSPIFFMYRAFFGMIRGNATKSKGEKLNMAGTGRSLISASQ